MPILNRIKDWLRGPSTRPTHEQVYGETAGYNVENRPEHHWADLVREHITKPQSLAPHPITFIEDRSMIFTDEQVDAMIVDLEALLDTARGEVVTDVITDDDGSTFGWQYGLVRHKDGSMSLAEVYHEHGKPTGWCEPFLYADADDDDGPVETMRQIVARIAKDLEKPVIVDDELDENERPAGFVPVSST